MNNQPEPVRNLTPWRGFIAVFLAVFCFVLAGSALVTFVMPKTYVAEARVRVATPDQAAIFQSQSLLAQVAADLNLPMSFAKDYGQSEPLTVERSVQMLRRNLRVKTASGGKVAEIRVFNTHPQTAARLANAIAQAGGTNSASILDIAVPSSKPVRPNMTLNLTLGALVGIFLGIMAGGLGARLAVGIDRTPRRTS